jgi:Fungal specific transcription factor domain
MLCSVAVRLALEKGMHRRPNKGWNLSDAEVAERNRVFWVLYFLDKTIALRSGRPSVSNRHSSNIVIEKCHQLTLKYRR